MRLYKIGKIYRPQTNAGIIAFDDYESCIGRSLGRRGYYDSKIITGHFLVIENRISYNFRMFLNVLSEERLFWIDSTFLNLESMDDF